MPRITVQNGRLVIRENKVGTELFCCCDPCTECTGSTCCGGDYPRSVGVCCEDVWRMPGEGTCCDGVWYVTGTPGECCGGVWHEDEDSGDCCDGVWHPVPEGQTAPDLSVIPFQPVAWPAEECPSGTLYARWGLYGECCGCISEQVFDPRAGEHEEGYPPPGAYVPTESVIEYLCCDICEETPYLSLDAYGGEIGCLGTCCADEDCSRLLQSQCGPGVHPTHPEATYYSWTSGGSLYGQSCCANNPCAVPCCVDGELVELAAFVVAGEVLEGEWTLTFGETTFTYTAVEGETAEDIANGLAAAVASPFLATATGATIDVTGPLAGAGTITPPGGEPQPPTSSETKLMSSGACSALGGTPAPSGDCGCQAGQTCCETATSSGTLLTFNKPAAFSGTVRVTVTGTTTGPILVYDTAFGQTATPSKQCPFTHTFLLCEGTFNISPLPCGGTFHRVDVEVCYEEESTSVEVFNFKGCNGPVSLGACPTECATTLLYTGAGLTSSAAISMYRDSTIEANGSGPLVLTGNITPVASCVETLTLTGTSTAANEIAGVIGILGSNPSVHKTGTGVWRITGNCTYYGPLRVLSGTLIVDSVAETGGSPFGGDANILPFVGDPMATGGVAALLVEAGTIRRGLTVESGGGSQVVILGGYGAGLSRFSSVGVAIHLGRDVTLQASTGGTIEFANAWLDSAEGTSPAVNFTIGSAGNTGEVVFAGSVPASITSVTVVAGTLAINSNDRMAREIPLTLGAATSSVTFDLRDFSQRLADISFVGPGSEITSTATGQLRLENFGGAVAVDVAGTGHEVSARVSVEGATTITGDGELLLSGVVSGSSAVTMDGSGTVTLSGSNTYTGTTTINGGTMKADSLTAFGTGDIVVNAGGTLDKNGYALANTITNNGGTVLN